MKREIKFRQAIFTDGKFSRFRYWGFLENGFSSPVDGGDGVLESQQFTGLTRNGIEIYEGDILQYFSHQLQVVWNDEHYCYAGKDLQSGYTSDLAALSFSRFEVIGNIYENPELLEAKP